MKKLISSILVIVFIASFGIVSFGEKEGKTEADLVLVDNGADFELDFDLTAAYLCEASTGKVLYSKDEFKAASIASVTKVMTLLLVCEALDAGRFSLSDQVRVSVNAASMGGSPPGGCSNAKSKSE